MGVSGLKCVRCGCMYPAEDRYFCEACGGILKLRMYRRVRMRASEHLVRLHARCAGGDSLGFGTTPTPLLRSRRLARGVGLEKLYFKCETANLTGSFKDRPVAVAVAMAQRLGYRAGGGGLKRKRRRCDSRLRSPAGAGVRDRAAGLHTARKSAPDSCLRRQRLQG